MNKILISLFIFIATVNTAFSETANNKTQPSLIFKNIVIPEAPPVASVMVAYLNITNNSNTKQTITKITSPQFKRVEIHEMSMSNGMMNMKKMKTLSFKAKQKISLEPGGLHVMLIKPIKPLKKGNTVELTFMLSSGELNTINTQVQIVD